MVTSVGTSRIKPESVSERASVLQVRNGRDRRQNKTNSKTKKKFREIGATREMDRAIHIAVAVVWNNQVSSTDQHTHMRACMHHTQNNTDFWVAAFSFAMTRFIFSGDGRLTVRFASRVFRLPTSRLAQISRNHRACISLIGRSPPLAGCANPMNASVGPVSGQNTFLYLFVWIHTHTHMPVYTHTRTHNTYAQ